MLGQNWNGVVNEGNPAVYLGLKSSVRVISPTPPLPLVTLYSPLLLGIGIELSLFFRNCDDKTQCLFESQSNI